MIKTILTIIIGSTLFLTAVITVNAQSCEKPASCQVNKSVTHIVEQFPCWDETDPLFVGPYGSYNQITLDDDGRLGAGNCDGHPNCTNYLVLPNPEPSIPVKGLWWRMHDHEEGARYDLEMCRTPLQNGNCSDWQKVVSDEGVHTSGDGNNAKEACSDTNESGQSTINTYLHPPSNQGCPDPLPDPKSCMQSGDRSDWPCALSFDEHTWAANACTSQIITAFRLVFHDGNDHVHVADALFMHDGSYCTIQGRKVPDTNPYKGQTIRLKNDAGQLLEKSATQPYTFKYLPAGKNYILEATGKNLLGSTLCRNNTECHKKGPVPTNDAFKAGASRKVFSCPANGYLDLYWHYGLAPTATATPSATTKPTEVPATATPTPVPGFCTQGASITLSDPPPPPEDDSNLITLKVKFQGAFANNITENNNSQNLKVTIIKQVAEEQTGIGLQTISSKTFENVEVINTNTVDENGIAIYEGSFDPVAIAPADTYSVLVKGPYHLQRKFCENAPTEQAEEGLPYTCKTVGTITLTKGDNILDFSGVLLQAGDLPGDQGQDGVVNAYDVSLIMSILEDKVISEEQSDLDQTDMDYNGIVNRKDRSNIIETLEEKYGDEEPY